MSRFTMELCETTSDNKEFCFYPDNTQYHAGENELIIPWEVNKDLHFGYNNGATWGQTVGYVNIYNNGQMKNAMTDCSAWEKL